MTGRKPKPTARKRLEGNPGKRPLNSREPKLPAPESEGPLPTELMGDVLALQEWARLEPMLRASKVLTAGDRGLLVALCQQWSRYLEATQKVAVSGLVIEMPGSGYPMTNPYIGNRQQVLESLRQIVDGVGSDAERAESGNGIDAQPQDRFSEFDAPQARMRIVKRRS